MPQFQITGLDAQGKAITRTLQAGSKAEASEKALDQEILLQSVRAVDRSKYKITVVEKLNFVRLLAVTTRSGLPLLTGLQTILRESKKGGLNRLTLDLISDLEEGSSISEGMANREGVFDELSVSLVKAGELSGRLPETLQQLYDYENAAHAFRKKVRGALAYPVVVFTFSLAVVALFMTVIVPRFRDTYDNFSGNLPAMTQLLLDVSDFFTSNIAWVGAFIAVLVAGFIYMFSRPRYRFYLERFWIRIPAFGDIFLWGVLVRFSRTLGTLLENQVNFLDSLFLAIEASRSSWFQQRLANTVDEVKEGTNFTDALERTEAFPELALQMVRMGEESGRLAELLTNMSDFYQQNMEHRVTTLESVIQPVVVIGLGLFIGFLVLALFLPMFDLPGVLK